MHGFCFREPRIPSTISGAATVEELKANLEATVKLPQMRHCSQRSESRVGPRTGSFMAERELEVEAARQTTGASAQPAVDSGGAVLPSLWPNPIQIDWRNRAETARRMRDGYSSAIVARKLFLRPISYFFIADDTICEAVR